MSTPISCVYQISCCNPNVTDSYVGSTNNKKARLEKHFQEMRKPLNAKGETKLYRFIKLANELWSFDVLEILPTDLPMQERLKHEGAWIEKLKPTLNTHTPRGLTKNERERLYRRQRQPSVTDI